MNMPTHETGSRFTHGPWSCRVIETRGAVVLAEGRVFPMSPPAWLVARIEPTPAVWDRRRWPWVFRPAGERFAVRELHQTEQAGREAFRRLGGGEA
jgi:hypothetical protein